MKLKIHVSTAATALNKDVPVGTTENMLLYWYTQRQIIWISKIWAIIKLKKWCTCWYYNKDTEHIVGS